MADKKGLILEGGGMRGMFTAGVIDVLMENGIEFDGTIGVSAGAAFGCNYKSKQIGRVIRYNTKYCRDKRYSSLRSLIKTGDMFGADFCYRELPEELDLFDVETYQKNPMDFYVVATDIESGKPAYKKCDFGDRRDLLWYRASASMPLVSRIVEIEGKKYLDGGISDSIPLKYFESIGYTKNIVVLTQPSDYVKKPNSALPLVKMAYKKYPGLISAMANRHEVYNETTAYIKKCELDGDVFIICPKEPLPVSRTEHNPDKLREAYNLGRTAAEEIIDKIKDFLR